MSYAAPKIFLHRNAIAWRGLGSFDQNLPVLARASAWQKNPIKLTRWPVRLTTTRRLDTMQTLEAPKQRTVRAPRHGSLEVMFDTTDATRKFVNLRRNARTAVAIGWDDNQTIQIEGLADEPAGQDLQRIIPSLGTPDPCGCCGIPSRSGS